MSDAWLSEFKVEGTARPRLLGNFCCGAFWSIPAPFGLPAMSAIAPLLWDKRTSNELI